MDCSKKIIILVIGFIVLICAITGISFYQNQRKEKEAKEHYELSRKYYVEGQNNSKTIEELKKAIALKPDYGEAYFGLGLNYEKLQDWDNAIIQLSNSIHYNPKDAKSFYIRGLCYWKRHNLENAISDFTNSLSLDSTQMNCYYQLGHAYSESHQYDAAIEAFLKADKLCSRENTSAIVDAASAYVFKHAETHDPNLLIESERLLKLAIERDESYPPAYFWLATVYRDENDNQKAIEFFKRGFSILTPENSKYPQVAFAHVDYGGILFHQKKNNLAKEELIKALEIMPNNEEGLALLGYIYFVEKQYDESFKLLQKCVSLYPDYNVVHHYLAIYYHYVKHDEVKAKEHWDIYCRLSTHIHIPSPH